jgi:hypothetical protein
VCVSTHSDGTSSGTLPYSRLLIFLDPRKGRFAPQILSLPGAQNPKANLTSVVPGSSKIEWHKVEAAFPAVAEVRECRVGQIRDTVGRPHVTISNRFLAAKDKT